MTAHKRHWKEIQLRLAVEKARSIRQVISLLGLQPAGGNYAQVKKYIKEYNLDTMHFKGKGWNRGLHGIGIPRIPLEKILVINSNYQSFKLKKRLFAAGVKPRQCEECGWARLSEDGRIPLELDHINGKRCDNRFENLRVLCPNCHSLKLTHRGKNPLKFSKRLSHLLPLM